jgi:hypothetical protein
VRQGSKLIWNKGVILKPAVKPSTSVTPTPVPTPAQTAIPVAQTYTPEIGKFYGTLYRDMDAILGKTPSTVKINWIISENAEARAHLKYFKSAEYAARLWEPYFNNSEINVVMFTEADSKWIDQKQTELMGSWLKNPTQQLQSYRLLGMGCNIAGFYLPNNFVVCTKTDTDRSSVYFASFSLAHEYTHLVMMTSKTITDIPIGDQRRLTPCWVNEGLGQFVGTFAASHIDSNFKEDRNNFFTTIGTTVDRASRNSVVNTMKELESYNDKSGEYCNKVQDAYFLGAIAFEKLTMDYGFTKVADSLKYFFSGATWSEAFKKAFGISTDDFYEQMATIITTDAWLA